MTNETTTSDIYFKKQMRNAAIETGIIVLVAITLFTLFCLFA